MRGDCFCNSGRLIELLSLLGSDVVCWCDDRARGGVSHHLVGGAHTRARLVGTVPRQQHVHTCVQVRGRMDLRWHSDRLLWPHASGGLCDISADASCAHEDPVVGAEMDCIQHVPARVGGHSFGDCARIDSARSDAAVCTHCAVHMPDGRWCIGADLRCAYLRDHLQGEAK